MTRAGKKLLEGVKEAVAIAKGDEPAAAIWHNGHRYVPESALLEAEQRGMQRAIDWHRKNARFCREIAQDDPRINEADRKRAGQAAIQHDASATGLEQLLIDGKRDAIRAKLDEVQP